MFETKRLTIRKFRKDDWQDLFEYLSLPEIYRFEPGSPISAEQAKDMAAEREKTDDFFAVALKTEGKLIGHLYFNHTQPKEFLAWELGFIFNPGYHNQGYCSEASIRILEYGFDELHAHRINAYCDPLNPASWKVLEKIGMAREGYFKKKAFFKKDERGQPLWHDCCAYGLVDEDRSRMTGSE